MAVQGNLLAVLLLLMAAQADGHGSSSGDRRSFNPFAKLTNAAAGAVPVNALLADVDINEVVERIDVNELLERVDLDAVMDGVDLNQLADRIDVDRILDRVDANRLLDRVDVDRLLDRVTPDQLLDRVTPDQLLDRVDPNRLLDRVDPNQLLERVDTDALVARTDLNSALDQVDFDRVLDRVDVKKVVDRAGVPDLVRESTGHMAGSVLDMGRRMVAAVDQVIIRVSTRVFHRRGFVAAAGPPKLMAAVGAAPGGQITGHYAGPLGRLIAFMVDVAVVFGAFTLMTAGVVFVFGDLLGQSDVSFSAQTTVGLVLLLSWAFSYGLISLVVAGRTIGKWMIGERIVDRSGDPIRAGQAVRRILAMPLSFLLLGLGFLGLFVGKRRRALHDILAGTVVVYDWGDRPAEMPAPLAHWIAGRSDTELPPPSRVSTAM